jgi:hypothetical protein
LFSVSLKASPRVFDSAGGVVFSPGHDASEHRAHPYFPSPLEHSAPHFWQACRMHLVCVTSLSRHRPLPRAFQTHPNSPKAFQPAYHKPTTLPITHPCDFLDLLRSKAAVLGRFEEGALRGDHQLQRDAHVVLHPAQLAGVRLARLRATRHATVFRYAQRGTTTSARSAPCQTGSWRAQ